MKSNKVVQILQIVILALYLFALTACFHKPPVILQDSVTMKIQKGDLPKSPEVSGWLLSESSLAKLLEAAEKCQTK